MSKATRDDLKAVERLIGALTPDKRQRLKALPAVAEQLDRKWLPNPGPQTAACDSLADELFFGGEAGGGKSDILMGLSVTAHRNALLLRRTNREAAKFIKRFVEMVGHRQGWSGQRSIFTLPGRSVEFGGCQLEEDKQKYKGDPHDLICVSRGTNVLLADGSYRPVEELRVGTMLATLEGPRKLEKIYPSQRKECVEVIARVDGEEIGRQVQSPSHALLSETASFLAAARGDAYASKASHASGKLLRWLPARYALPSRHLPESIGRFLHMAEFVQPFWDRQRDWVRRAFYQGYDQEIGFVAFDGGSLMPLPPLSFDLPALRLPFPPSDATIADRRADERVGDGARSPSLHEDCRKNCSADLRLHGERTQRYADWEIAEGGGQRCLLLSGDAVEPTPNDSQEDGSAETHKHSRRIHRYVHPYTGRTRQVSQSCRLIPATLDVSPAGVRDVFDIQVEEVRHYITEGGFVNQNCFDEIADFSESQYRFIIGWNRSADPNQRCRVVAAGNPPTRIEGRWVIKYWGAWLDPTHPDPAKEGELRWYTTVDGEDREVDGPGPHLVGGEWVRARSRSFIRSQLVDNPDLAEGNYDAVLAALPAELRTAYRDGRFDLARPDDDWQTIPTAWIAAAQQRWRGDGHVGLAMTTMALDPAGGGRDSAELACRYGGWYAPLVSARGPVTTDASAMAGLVIRYRRDGCPVVVDVGGGYGGGVITRFTDNGIAFLRFDGAARSQAAARGSGLKFANKRSEAWWRFREELDPDQDGGSRIALPPDDELAADLAAPRWTPGPRGIQLEAKESIRARLGRSPGKGDAVVMALSEGERAVRLSAAGGRRPQVLLGYGYAKCR